jgi:hypothetical protein
MIATPSVWKIIFFYRLTVPEWRSQGQIMSEAPKPASNLVAKMRANTEQQQRRTSVKQWRQSRKKVQKNRPKKA